MWRCCISAVVTALAVTREDAPLRCKDLDAALMLMTSHQTSAPSRLRTLLRGVASTGRRARDGRRKGTTHQNSPCANFTGSPHSSSQACFSAVKAETSGQS